MWGGALTFSGTYYFKTDLALAMTQCLIFILFVKKLRWYNYTLAVLASVMIFLSNARISFVIAFMIFGLVMALFNYVITFINNKAFSKKVLLDMNLPKSVEENNKEAE